MLSFINCWQSFLWVNLTSFFKFIISDWNGHTPTFSIFSLRIRGICPALLLHVDEAIVELVINIFSYTKVRFKLLKTLRAFIKFTYLLSKICIWKFRFYSILFHCILSIIAINSCLLNSLRVSSVKDATYVNNKNNASYKIKL